MSRQILNLLGLGMIALWIVGLSSTPETPYMTWLDGAGGLFSFVIAGSFPQATRAARSGPIFVLSVCLFGLWLAGLLSGAVNWQVWWTFGAACAYFVLGVIAGSARPSAQLERDTQHPRRAA